MLSSLVTGIIIVIDNNETFLESKFPIENRPTRFVGLL